MVVKERRRNRQRMLNKPAIAETQQEFVTRKATPPNSYRFSHTYVAMQIYRLSGGKASASTVCAETGVLEINAPWAGSKHKMGGRS